MTKNLFYTNLPAVMLTGFQNRVVGPFKTKSYLKTTLLSFFVLILNSLYGQLILVDENKLPIANVELAVNKHVFAKSVGNGSVAWSKLAGIGINDTIYFIHPGYNRHWEIKKNIKNRDTIILTEKVYILPDITVSSAAKKYQIIDAYYRSYQLNDDSLIFYTDGMIEYLSKIKKKKYYRRLKEYRSYQDSNYIANANKKKIYFEFNGAGIVQPLPEYLPESYFKSHKLIVNRNASGSFNILTKDSLKIGTITKDSNFVTYSIDDVYSCKKRSIFSFEAIQLKSDVTLVFKVNENSDDLLFDSFDKLVYSKIYRQYNIKHETEQQYTKIEGVEELFVEAVYYLNEVETDNYHFGYGFPQKSNYSTPFWEQCNCELYQKPPYSSLILNP